MKIEPFFDPILGLKSPYFTLLFVHKLRSWKEGKNFLPKEFFALE